MCQHHELQFAIGYRPYYHEGLYHQQSLQPHHLPPFLLSFMEYLMADWLQNLILIPTL